MTGSRRLMVRSLVVSSIGIVGLLVPVRAQATEALDFCFPNQCVPGNGCNDAQAIADACYSTCSLSQQVVYDCRQTPCAFGYINVGCQYV